MKRTKIFFNLVEKAKGDVFWNCILIRQVGGNKISIMIKEYDITLDIQMYFTKTNFTTKPMNIGDKSTFFNYIKNIELYI